MTDTPSSAPKPDAADDTGAKPGEKAPVSKWIGLGVGAGIGSAAIAAALLYANRGKGRDKNKDR